MQAKKKRKKPIVMWAVRPGFLGKSRVWYFGDSFGETRKVAIENFLRVQSNNTLYSEWPAWKREGYRCVKVKITEMK